MILCRILRVAWALLSNSATFSVVECAIMHHASRIHLHSTPVKLQVLPDPAVDWNNLVYDMCTATRTYPLHKSHDIHYVCTIVHIAAG
ncbi:hypothetical protein EDC04DRAFT_2716254 [Pisolithus marmoratus]|nr:hypothetical protein EDC04DRAFT_2716254 [Pisolithus marmoratus]